MRIHGAAMEAGGYTGAHVFFNQTPIGVTITDSVMASATVPSIDCNAVTIERLCLFNNQFGGGTETVPYPIVNSAFVSSAITLNNFSNGTKLFDNDIAGSYAFCLDTLAGTVTRGLGVNILNAAAALVDALITSEGAPLFRVLGSDGVATTVERFAHRHPDVRRHDVRLRSVSTLLLSNEAGVRTVTDFVQLATTDAAAPVATFELDYRSTAFVDVTVIQSVTTETGTGTPPSGDAVPSHYAAWRLSTVAYSDAGGITLDALTSASLPNFTGFTAPVLTKDDVARTISVQISPHAADMTSAMVKVEITQVTR